MTTARSVTTGTLLWFIHAADTKTETDTDTDRMCIEPNGNLYKSPCLSRMNTFRQFFTSHF